MLINIIFDNWSCILFHFNCVIFATYNFKLHQFFCWLENFWNVVITFNLWTNRQMSKTNSPLQKAVKNTACIPFSLVVNKNRAYTQLYSNFSIVSYAIA